ncbi:galectin-4-like [Sitophilus oryzae]|uniref:Galectin n=1 Tax=Sitophilus oryzae TaxID=7048 RepID=A0A6J2XP56_SITOR|nr:galectin-4-like [Sitophilus oryzae]
MSHISSIPGGLRAGLNVTIKGQVPADSDDKFVMNFQTGDQDTKNIAFHSSLYVQTGCIVRNSKVDGTWGTSDISYILKVKAGQQFLINIAVKSDVYAVTINNETLYEFAHRVPLDQTDHLFVYGNCTIDSVIFEYSETVDTRILNTTTQYSYSNA